MPSVEPTKIPKRAEGHQSRIMLKIEKITSAVAGLICISLVLFAYKRALVPLYAIEPTTYLIDKIVVAAVFLAALNPISCSSRISLYNAIGLAMAPNATYWMAVLTSRKRDPVIGPAITHIAVLSPLIFLLTTLVVRTQKISLPPVIYRIILAGACFAVGRTLSHRLWENATFLYYISESEIFLGSAGILFCVWIAQLPIASKRQKGGLQPSSRQIKSITIVAFLAFWISSYKYLASPVLPHPLKQTYTNLSNTIKIHSASQSVTGLVVVGEALPPKGYDGQDDQEMHSVRYLRASHSILGGVWVGSKVHVLDDGPPMKDSFGTPLGDSIYSTFVLQEAVRLVNSTEKGKAVNWENGLVIGLGVGTSVTSFIRHGISTSIVEIDPAVYHAARTFFGLPDPGSENVFLEDARVWVEEKRRKTQAIESKERKYDFVVHDCFSGGGVPGHIFTAEFWNELKAVMHPEGIVVVNFAGIPQTDPTRMVLYTLEKSFGQCRAFHDLFGALHDYDKEFINIVFFCTSSKEPLSFRESHRADWLGSPLRRHVFNSLATREVKLDLIRDAMDEEGNKYLLTDARNPLGKLQGAQALHHWKLMREVLPDVHWETY